MAATSPRGKAREAVKDWLEAGNILYLNKVFSAPPLRMDLREKGTPPYQAQAVLFIDDEGELRMAFGGAFSGKKRIDYMMSLEVYFSSVEIDTEAAQDAFDVMIDQIKARLRLGGHTAGISDETVVWQVAEGGYGIQCDFMDPSPQPNVGGEPIEHYARVRFECSQWRTC